MFQSYYVGISIYLDKNEGDKCSPLFVLTRRLYRFMEEKEIASEEHHEKKRAIRPSEDIIESTEAIELGDSAISIAAEVSLWATTSDRMPNRNKTERCEIYCAR